MKQLKITSPIRFLLFLSLLVFSMNSNAQELRFKTLTVNDGLTQHDVSCIFQDSQGFIWIGTYDGLNRFDGLKVKNFVSETDNPESLSSNRILCLFEDSKKRIWIGTDGSGLNYYSLTTEKFVRIETPERFNIIKHIAENDKGEIFVATGNGILKLTDADQPALEILQLPLTGITVNHILNTNENGTFFATDHGIWQMKGNNCKQLTEFGNSIFRHFAKDVNDNIWATGDYRLLIFEPRTKQLIQKPNLLENINIRTLCSSKNSSIWLGTMNSGLVEIDALNYKIKNKFTASFFQSRSLMSNTVMALFLDNSNTLWVGNRKGTCYANLTQKKFESIPLINLENISPRPHVRNLFIDGDNIYISSLTQGSILYSQKTQQYKKLLDAKNNDAHCFNKFNGKIHIGGNNGVFVSSGSDYSFTKKKFRNDNGRFVLGQTYSMCQDANATIYYGTTNGLVVETKDNVFRAHNKFKQADILKELRIWSLYYDKLDNCVWMGTISHGLYKMNLTDKGDFLSLEVFNKSLQGNYHISNNTIWCFYKDPNNNLWIGTDAGLFMRAHNRENFTQIEKKGIKDRKIMGIEEDAAGNFWLANSRGLIFFNPIKNETRAYNYNDGLNTNTLTEAVGKTDDGILFFGGINGVNFFNPSEIKDNPYPANIAISDFRIHNISIVPGQNYFGRKVLNESINLTKKVTLNHKQNNFFFEFAGTNYANSSENTFKYKLDGYDDNWINTTSKYRFATYSNLKQGTYTFNVNAANHDGFWSNTPKQIEIEILPPPWLSIWAYIIYFVLFGGIASVILYFVINRQRMQHQMELEHVQHKKDKEINELKLIFFTDIAHEFKTPLSLIIGPLNDLIENKLSPEHRDFCYKIVSRNTKRMMFLVNQLLDFRKINANKNILKVTQSNLAEFLNQTVKAFLWQAKNEGIDFRIIAPTSFKCFFDRDIIEKVTYNLLSNAFKYTPENGIVEIEVKPIWKQDQQVADIIIRDSGKGIPDEQKNKIFERYFHGKDRLSSGIGLHLSNNLIKAHKGEINVADSRFGGTEFIVSIPVAENNYEQHEFFESGELKTITDEIRTPQEMPHEESTGEKERILIVEDDHDLRAYLKNILQNQYSVLEATNGIKGLKVATNKLPDIIISDVMMPEMDGIEMCKELKKNSETSHIPILMVTAKTAEEQQKEGLEAGAWDYISKPFNTQALTMKIENILETRNKFKDYLISQDITVEVKKHYTPFDQKLITRATKIVEERISEPNFSVEDFAMEIGLSRMQLHRKLKTLVGQTTTGFINHIKILHATKLFDEGCDRINEAMDAVGISSYSHFNTLFKKANGKSASDYIAERNGGVKENP
ncbi:response regulator [uncultured Draconibacterium sp.]|uniref:hybrid sensor histidine kinase/response regulator transcription factor n=1 Tax=uncultured Draconibacterium sp. TaxID=1573823 RepID=UPI0029BFC740|nr:response regulator [uncultured Draconibacterium sp.]